MTGKQPARRLADILAAAFQQARDGQAVHVPLTRGLHIVLDYRDPHMRQIRFGRPAPTWPSSAEISTCRRFIDIPPGADTIRVERDGWNVIIYAWPTSGQAAWPTSGQAIPQDSSQ